MANADAILNTPLFDSITQDSGYWWASKDGNYPVKTAYNLLMERVVDLSHHHCAGEWKKLWSLTVPPKVKISMWRACRSLLPMHCNLQVRGIHCPTRCLSCSNALENEWHCFLTCPGSTLIWQRVGMWEVLEPLLTRLDNFPDLFFHLVNALDDNKMRDFVWLMWSIWKKRNTKLWENKDENCYQVIMRAMQTKDDWDIEVAVGSLVNMVDQERLHSVWAKPMQGYLKCNLDAAFFKAENTISAGMCFRNDRDHFVIAKTEWSSPLLLVHEGEASCFLKALWWALDLSLVNVIFELDCKYVVDVIHGGRIDAFEFGAIIGRCREVLASNPTFKVKFVRRQANVVAHKLARAAISKPSLYVFRSTPHCIGDAIAIEII